MKPDCSPSPTRASSRIKAKAVNNNKNDTNVTAASADTNKKKRAPPQDTASSSSSSAALSFLFQQGDEQQPKKNKGVGVPPKLSREKSNAAPAASAHPPPYAPPPPPYTTSSKAPRPTTTMVDAKTLEERKRQALAYAMQQQLPKNRSSTSSSIRGRGGGGRYKLPTKANAPSRVGGGDGNTNSSSSATVGDEGGMAGGQDTIGDSSSGLLPMKRKPGRPRKNNNITGTSSSDAAKGTATSSTSPKRKAGRPRKTPVYQQQHQQHQQQGYTRMSSTTEGSSSDAANDLTALSRGLQKEFATDALATDAGVKVTQSLPNSNVNSDNEYDNDSPTTRSSTRSSTRGNTKRGNRHDSPSNYSRASKYNPLPLKRTTSTTTTGGENDEEDDEYARFMRSLMNDDQSIITFRTLQSIKSSTSAAGKDSVVGSAFETMDEDDVSYQLTSDEEDGDDDDELEDGSSEGETPTAAPLKESPYKQTLPPTPLPHQDANDEELLNVFGEIEGLMEEDLEAAVMASLIGEGGGGGNNSGSGGGVGGESTTTAPNTWGCVGGKTMVPGSRGGKPASKSKASGSTKKIPPRPPGSNTCAIMGSTQQMNITTPGYSTKKHKSTTTVVTSPFIPARGTKETNAAIEVPAVSKDQLARLRQLMANHHQLLLQQATLSVRAAYVQKVRKSSSSNNNTPSPVPSGGGSARRGGGKKGTISDSSILPESRLDTRSLTFCSQPVDSGCSYVNDFHNGETPEELSECLDGAVGMLQDLEQNWKDAVRNSIQLGAPALLPTMQQQQQSNSSASNHSMGESAENDGCRRLTRSAFTRTLLEREEEDDNNNNKPSSPAKQHPSTSHGPQARTSVFAIRGLSHLKETFSALDNSVKDIQMGREKGNNKDGINILAPEKHTKACEILLKHARAEMDVDHLYRADLGEVLTHAPEAFDDPENVNHPLTKKQEAELRRNRHSFTAGEDNLIMRGVNLYGEKEWCLVSDRFLPDRVVNSISQRYNKLCYLIYKANGIEIDDKGKLPTIPTMPKGTVYDMSKLAMVTPARAPTTMNVHRWTLEEDIAVLKATPIMGNSWAEIATRLMPHRDRGHIRKRFQVLQRRIPKGMTKMSMRYLKRDAEGQPLKSPGRSPKRARASSSRSPAKKRTPKKMNASPKAGSKVPASPADIFERAAQLAQKHRPPVSPIKSGQPEPSPQSPPKKAKHFASHVSQALFQAVDAVQHSNGPSPETRDMASVLGGFSQGSRLDSLPTQEQEEDTKMGVEKILDNDDDWSQASGMQRLIEAGAAESNFVALKDAASSEGQDKGNEKRKSILSSVLEKSNARKRKSSAAFPSTPTKQTSRENGEGYPSSIPTSAISFNLATPGREEAMSSLNTANGELTMDPEFFEYFMNDKSRQKPTPGRMEASSASAANYSPIKLGNIAASSTQTPLSQFGALGSISGPLDGDNSLFMQASEFDAVAALKDLSNSAPNTPSKLLNPRDSSLVPSEEDARMNPVQEEDGIADETKEVDEKVAASSSKNKPKTSFLANVKRKVEERKMGASPK